MQLQKASVTVVYKMFVSCNCTSFWPMLNNLLPCFFSIFIQSSVVYLGFTEAPTTYRLHRVIVNVGFTIPHISYFHGELYHLSAADLVLKLSLFMTNKNVELYSNWC